MTDAKEIGKVDTTLGCQKVSVAQPLEQLEQIWWQIRKALEILPTGCSPSSKYEQKDVALGHLKQI
jgi:hypothetical protein